MLCLTLSLTRKTNLLTMRSIYCTRPLNNPLYSGKPETCTLANTEDPDEMQHNAAFHQDLHCLLSLKQSSGTEIHHNLENYTSDPLKYTMGSPILIVSICIRKSEYKGLALCPLGNI